MISPNVESAMARPGLASEHASRYPPFLRSDRRVVWIATAQDGSEDPLECLDLVTALGRAADAQPRSFSLMLTAAALEVLGPDATLILRRAHRIVVCGEQMLAETPLSRSRVGHLPRWFDVDAFSTALAWLTARPSR